MSSPTGSSQWFANPDSFYNGVATQSLRFDRASDPFLNRTATLGNRKTWTFSTWLKRSGFTSAVQYIFGTNVNNNDATSANIHIGSDNMITVAPWANYFVKTNALLRDVGAWYHIVVDFDTTQAGSGNSSRVNIYINGVDQALTNGGATLSQNSDWAINLNQANTRIGDLYGDANELDGYLAETNFVDGLSLDASYFGETKNGVWIPKQPDVSEYGTNGFRLKFDQAGVGTAGTSTIGADTSGKTNHFTSSGIVASDCAMPDSPENNFATLNPLALGTDGTLSEGNLKIIYGSASTRTATTATIGVSSGKWYWEVNANHDGGETIGITNASDYTGTYPGQAAGSSGYYSDDGQKYIGGTNSDYGATFTTGDIVAFALDMDAGTLVAYKNNSSQGTLVSSLTGDQYPAIGDGGATGTTNNVFNFGQDSSFAGNETAQGNKDGNGIGDFYYAPPSGFLALCTANLEEPTIGPNSITQADDHFSSVLWTGGSGDVAVSGVGFKPDWVWMKARSNAQSHSLVDSSRGGTKLLNSNSTGAENSTNSGNDLNEIHFTDDGFTSNTDWHTNNYTYVAWNWKANGGTTTTNDASSTSVGSIDSVIQANTIAGFSIVVYTGVASSNQTVAHGLQVGGVATAPEMIMFKKRGSTSNWNVIHPARASNDHYMQLNSNSASINTNTPFAATAPTTTVFTVGANDGDVNTDGQSHIAYCFASVEGYSKIGGYIGNGSADGSFVFTGFRPAFLLMKRTDATGYWAIWDVVRDVDNAVINELTPNSTDAETTAAGVRLDILSNGFKLRNSGAAYNASGATVIYMAFAEAPFKYANAR